MKELLDWKYKGRSTRIIKSEILKVKISEVLLVMTYLKSI